MEYFTMLNKCIIQWFSFNVTTRAWKIVLYSQGKIGIFIIFFLFLNVAAPKVDLFQCVNYMPVYSPATL